MQQWEYMVLARTLKNREWKWAKADDKRNSQEVLNDLGKQGWELVAAPSILESLYQTGSLSADGAATVALHYIFKRPL